MILKQQVPGSTVCVNCGHVISLEDSICPLCHYPQPSTLVPLFPSNRSNQDKYLFWGYQFLVIGGCAALYGATLLGDRQGINNSDVFNVLAPSFRSLLSLGAAGALPVFDLGRWWTVLSTGWLHGSLLHIIFNLVWFQHLATQIYSRFGPSRLIVLYTLAVCGGASLTSWIGHLFLWSSPWQGAIVTVGASGGLFGLLGAMVAYGQFMGDRPIQRQYWTYALVAFLSGFLVPHVDNWNHLGGFLTGYILSWIPGLNSQTLEASWILGGAIVCLLLTVLSIVYSVMSPI